MQHGRRNRSSSACTSPAPKDDIRIPRRGRCLRGGCPTTGHHLEAATWVQLSPRPLAPGIPPQPRSCQPAAYAALPFRAFRAARIIRCTLALFSGRWVQCSRLRGALSCGCLLPLRPSSARMASSSACFWARSSVRMVDRFNVLSFLSCCHSLLPSPGRGCRV